MSRLLRHARGLAPLALLLSTPAAAAPEPVLLDLTGRTALMSVATWEPVITGTIAGDIDGDGLADVVLGDPGDDTIAEDAGAVWVFHGSEGGVETTPRTGILGVRPGEATGTAVFAAGDVDGDGYGDVLVVSADRVALHAGSCLGLGEAPSVVLDVRGAPAVGDFDADGHADLAFVRFPPTLELFRGGPLGPMSEPDVSVPLDAYPLARSLAVSGVGDVDGDGYDDLELTVIDDGILAGYGHLLVYRGGPEGLGLDTPWLEVGTDVIGSATVRYRGAHGVGDVNGDGRGDIAVSSRVTDAWGHTEARLALWSWDGKAFRAVVLDATEVDGLGDLDGDGYDDLVTWSAFGGRLLAGHDMLLDMSPTALEEGVVPTAGGARVDGDCAADVLATWTTYGDHTTWGVIPGAPAIDGAGGYADLDGDGAVNPDDWVCGGVADPAAPVDCDDHDPAVFPTATELAGDGVDADCDGWELCYLDADGDGHGGHTLVWSPETDCAAGGYFDTATDCDDADAAASPGRVEIPGDGRDGDCDGLELCYRDVDADGFAGEWQTASEDLTCSRQGLGDTVADCDDQEYHVAPGAMELCNGADDDCDGAVDEGRCAEAATPCGCAGLSAPALTPGLLGLLFLALRRRAREAEEEERPTDPGVPRKAEHHDPDREMEAA